jgi:hypothetical protein
VPAYWRNFEGENGGGDLLIGGNSECVDDESRVSSGCGGVSFLKCCWNGRLPLVGVFQLTRSQTKCMRDEIWHQRFLTVMSPNLKRHAEFP